MTSVFSFANTAAIRSLGFIVQATSIVGLIKLERRGYFLKKAKVVVILTGHGLKDPDFAIKNLPSISHQPADLNSLLKKIDSSMGG